MRPGMTGHGEPLRTDSCTQGQEVSLGGRQSLQRCGRAVPDKPQGVQSEPGLLEGRCQFLLLCLRQSDFLRANMVVDLRKHLQALHLVAGQHELIIQKRVGPRFAGFD